MRQDPPQGTVALEEAFIMRLPNQELADKVHDLIKDDKVNERLLISMDSYHRRAEVVLKPDKKTPLDSGQNIKLAGKLVDLPTINEIYKSLDDINMYKCADLHQMLILQLKDEFELKEKLYGMKEKEQEYDLNDVAQLAMRNQMYAYPHGLLPPFKNVRKKRFRKTAKRKFINSAELEKDVKDLLREDTAALTTDFKIEFEDIDKNKIKQKNKMRKKAAYSLDGDYERVYGNNEDTIGEAETPATTVSSIGEDFEGELGEGIDGNFSPVVSKNLNPGLGTPGPSSSQTQSGSSVQGPSTLPKPTLPKPITNPLNPNSTMGTMGPPSTPKDNFPRPNSTWGPLPNNISSKNSSNNPAMMSTIDMNDSIVSSNSQTTKSTNDDLDGDLDMSDSDDSL